MQTKQAGRLLVQACMVQGGSQDCASSGMSSALSAYRMLCLVSCCSRGAVEAGSSWCRPAGAEQSGLGIMPGAAHALPLAAVLCMTGKLQVSAGRPDWHILKSAWLHMMSACVAHIKETTA